MATNPIACALAVILFHSPQNAARDGDYRNKSASTFSASNDAGIRNSPRLSALVNDSICIVNRFGREYIIDGYELPLGPMAYDRGSPGAS